MRKKSLVGIALAGVMAIGMCMPVMAGADNNGNTLDGDTTITYNVPVKYTVDIPSSLVFDGTETEIKFTGSSFVLAEGAKVKVKPVASEVTLKLGQNHTTTVNIEGTAELTEDKETKLSVKPGQTLPTVAGIYTGSVKFNVEYVDATPAP